MILLALGGIAVWLGYAAQPDLETLIQKYLELRWASSPVEASEAGVAGYEHLLPDFSAEATAGRIGRERELLAEIREADPARLSPEQRIDRLLLIAALEHSTRTAERRRPWETTPELYVPFAALAPFLEKPDRPEAERASHLAARLRAVPRLVAQGRENLKNPPRIFTEAAIFQTAGTLRFLKEEVSAFAENVPDRKKELLSANAEAIRALEGFEGFLKDDLLPRSTGSWVLGEEDYNFILKRRWFLKDDAAAIRAKGERVFAETEAQAQQVAARMEPGKHWVEVYEKVKDDHPQADQIKAAYQAQMDRARAFLSEHEIVTLPAGERVITVDTPRAMRRSSPFGTFDAVGPFEKSRLGRLVLTPIEDHLTSEQRRERLRSHHHAWIPIIAVHEAYPGHHVHALLTAENPRVLRRVLKESISSEGWGLYTEEMMWQQGFLKGDDVRLTQLRNRLWRAARVIVDVSLHTGQMSFEQGVRFLVDKVRFERYAAELEVGMYVRRPTTVLGYLIGMMEIEKIRDDYYRKFGKPDKPREFYDKLLRVGAIPPALVRAELLGEELAPAEGSSRGRLPQVWIRPAPRFSGTSND